MAASLRAQAQEEPKCILCLDSLICKDDYVICLTPCGHVFHSNCIKESRKNWILEEQDLFESGFTAYFRMKTELCPQCRE